MSDASHLRRVQRRPRTAEGRRRHFSTTSHRDDAVSLLVNVPGEYREIDVLRDGSVDVEVYASRGISDDPLGAIDALISRKTDQAIPERT